MILQAHNLAMDPLANSIALFHAGLFTPKGYNISSLNPHLNSCLVDGFLAAYPWLKNNAYQICIDVLANSSHHPSEVGHVIALAAEAPFKKENLEVNACRLAHLRKHFGMDTTTFNNGTVARHIYGTGCGSVTQGTPKWLVLHCIIPCSPSYATLSHISS